MIKKKLIFPSNQKLISLSLSIGDEEGWQLWDTIDTNRTKATVQGLQKGKEYQFRIIAINKAGKSDPSHSSRGREALPRSRKNNITAVCLCICLPYRL